MPALTIHIPEAARLALEDLAETECRTPRDQAAFLVLQGLRAAATAAATPARPQPGHGRQRVETSAGAAEAEA